MITEYSRLIQKRTDQATVIPTVPVSNDLNDFTATDIFVGEIFINVTDDTVFTRTNNGILQLNSGGIQGNLTGDLTTDGFNIVVNNGSQLYNIENDKKSSLELGVPSIGGGSILKTEDLVTSSSSQIIIRDFRIDLDVNTDNLIVMRNNTTELLTTAGDIENRLLLDPGLSIDKPGFRSKDNDTGDFSAIRFTPTDIQIATIELTLPLIPTYADNAAAVAGGYPVGGVYKTSSGELRIVV
jgi:hypothetical protein